MTVCARDVEPGMVLARLDPTGRSGTFRTATVVAVTASIASSREDGEADRAIRWSDRSDPMLYPAHHRFIEETP